MATGPSAGVSELEGEELLLGAPRDERAQWALRHIICPVRVEVDEEGTLAVTLRYGSHSQPLHTTVRLRTDWGITCECLDYAVHRRHNHLCKHCWFVLFSYCKVGPRVWCSLSALHDRL